MTEKKLVAKLYTATGEVKGDFDLPAEIFGVEVNQTLVAQAVRVYLANQRRGTANTKTRGEVSGGGRKPWKQKGTGRARQGSIRSPLWIKGGIVHGPRPKDYSLKMSKKMKKLALFSALADKFKNDQLKVVESLRYEKPNTKMAKELLEKLGIKRSTLVVWPVKSDNEYLSFRNIDEVDSIIAYQLNPYEIVSHHDLVITAEAIGVLLHVEEKTEKENK